MINVLLPTDFSENAMNAIKYALEFFKYENTNFYFMHAYQAEVYNHKDLLSRTDFDAIVEDVSLYFDESCSTTLCIGTNASNFSIQNSSSSC